MTYSPRYFEVPTVTGESGNLSFLNGLEHVPFAIARTYFLWGIPRGVNRGGHAHRKLEQALIAVHGSLKVRVTVGGREEDYLLENATHGLLLGPLTWRTLTGFSQDTVLLVLASEPYDESDYIRNFDDFMRAEQAL